ncbi:SMC-Scp complex subunit ScpB [Patescibacteria group bacterium]|nr:SMC-Scp complex subunit ScpB [Patescibacteria group bacterium]
MNKKKEKEESAIPENFKESLESVIFVAGKPIQFKKIMAIFGLEKRQIVEEAEALQAEYKEKNRGIHLLLTKDAVEMVTNPAFSKHTSQVASFELEEKLSDAALETMAIVAYRGPITRAEIELIRGVNSVYTLRNLSVRGLVLKKPNPDDARMSIYEVSEKFLKHSGLMHETDLPNFSELSKKTTFEEYLDQKEKDSQKQILDSVNRE